MELPRINSVTPPFPKCDMETNSTFYSIYMNDYSSH